jgi:hypothetical protein
MAGAQELFDAATDRSMRLWRAVYSLAMFSGVAKDIAGSAMFDQATKALDEASANKPQIAALDRKILESFLMHQASATVAGAVEAEHAARLVFAHAVLDSAVNELLRVDASARPTFWERAVERDKLCLTIEEIRQSRYDAVLSRTIDVHLRKLENQALGNRVRVLHDGCRSTLSAFELPGYSFSADRIRLFNQARNSIIHGEALAVGVANPTEDVNYAWRTNYYLNVLVQAAGGLSFDADHWLNRSVRH